MSVIDCPVCGRPVNAEAIRCPECGADPRLPSEEARAELAARHMTMAVHPAEPPLPGWSRRRRLLVAIPALILPVACAVAGLIVLVDGLRSYYSLPVAERGADGDPFSADAGIWLGLMLVLFALLLAALASGSALPRRLGPGLGVVILIASLAVLILVAWAAVWTAGGGWSMCICLPFAYVPVLTGIRLLWQSSAGRSGRPPSTRLARPTSTST